MKAITRKELEELYNRARALKADRATKTQLVDNAVDLAWGFETAAARGVGVAKAVETYNDAARYWMQAAGYTPKNYLAHMEYSDAAENCRQMAEYFARYLK